MNTWQQELVLDIPWWKQFVLVMTVVCFGCWRRICQVLLDSVDHLGVDDPANKLRAGASVKLAAKATSHYVSLAAGWCCRCA